MVMMQSIPLTISHEMINRPIHFFDNIYLVDIAKSSAFMFNRVFLLIDTFGNVQPIIENQMFNNVRLVSETQNMPTPHFLIDVEDFLKTPKVDLNQAFDTVREILCDVVDFDDEYLYDLVTAYCMYTWVRGLFHKNINLYILGFPATGKSQVSQFVKKFARYPIDFDPDSEKSAKWFVTQTLGTFIIDEAEYLTKRTIARLRKYHEITFETRMLGLPQVGLTQIVMRVDAPIVVSATHMPSDPAFLSRGIIIRMKKGTPKIKSLKYIENIDEIKMMFIKSTLCSWAIIFDTLQDVLHEVQDLDVDERVKDVAIPLMTILKAVNRDYMNVINYAEKSMKSAYLSTPENVIYTLLLMRLRTESYVIDNKYVIDYATVYRIIHELADQFMISISKLKYLLQYLYAGCEEECIDDNIYFICDKETVDNVLKIFT